VNADTYEEEDEGAAPPSAEQLAAAAASGGEGEEAAATHRPFDVSVLGRYDFRLRPTNFLPGFKSLRAPAILDYVRAHTQAVCLMRTTWVEEESRTNEHTPNSLLTPQTPTHTGRRLGLL